MNATHIVHYNDIPKRDRWNPVKDAKRPLSTNLLALGCTYPQADAVYDAVTALEGHYAEHDMHDALAALVDDLRTIGGCLLLHRRSSEWKIVVGRLLAAAAELEGA